MRWQLDESDGARVVHAAARTDLCQDLWNDCVGIICSCWRPFSSIIELSDDLRQQRVSGLQKPHNQRDRINLQLAVERVDCELQDERFECGSERVRAVTHKFHDHVDDCVFRQLKSQVG